MSGMFEWSDLRHFLAVARGGSTLAAAKTLGVNQTTVARRIQALEEAIGEKLFERASGGYRLTAVGQAMLPHAERVETDIDGFRAALAQAGRRRQVIRVTAADQVADMLVIPWQAEFGERFPGVEVETIVTDTRLDLTRGEADIAIRAGATAVEGEGIVTRKLASGNWGLYASKDYVARHGRPRSVEELGSHAIIGAAGPLAPYEPQVMKRARELGAQVRTSSSTISNIHTAVKNGLGLGTLPCMVAEPDGLVFCFVLEELRYDLKLIIREEIRSLPHVRAFCDFIIARTAALRDVITGPVEAAKK
jgi:DNA-binding transcriptional LysR family regulator